MQDGGALFRECVRQRFTVPEAVMHMAVHWLATTDPVSIGNEFQLSWLFQGAKIDPESTEKLAAIIQRVLTGADVQQENRRLLSMLENSAAHPDHDNSNSESDSDSDSG